MWFNRNNIGARNNNYRRSKQFIQPIEGIIMKFSLTAIAVTISLLYLLPLSAFAESRFYGSVRIGLEHSDPGGEADAQTVFRNWASRMGFQGETEMENGLTGFGKYEWGVDTASNNNGNGALSTRHAYVGVKGDFGSLLIGQTYHTWYNTIIGPVDQPWWGSCNGCISYTGRTGQALTYSGDFGVVKGGATIYMVDGGEDSLDGFEVGASFDAGPVKIGVAMQDLDDPNLDPEATIGIVVAGDAGPVTYAFNITSQDAAVKGGEDATGIDLYAGFGNAYIDIGQIDQGNKPFGVTLGYTYSVGKQTTMWFEAQTVDPDAKDENGKDLDNQNTLRVALKHDW